MLLKPNGGPVYRAMRNAGCIQQASRTVNATAYLRRPQKDANGVSVAASKIAVFAMLQPKGIAELESNRIRRIRNPKSGENLEIIADQPTEPETEPQHGNIIGIPYSSDDPETAEFLAGELARSSVLISAEEFTALRSAVLGGG